MNKGTKIMHSKSHVVHADSRICGRPLKFVKSCICNGSSIVSCRYDLWHVSRKLYHDVFSVWVAVCDLNLRIMKPPIQIQDNV